MSEPLRIAVVEDEALILMQIEMALEDAGHIVVGTAVTAGEAIALIHQTHPDLVLIDLRLGDGSSGLDVANAVRTVGGITAAFMTANDRQLSDDLNGAMAVIAKPFSCAVLEDALVYLEECVRRPPPGDLVPRGMRVAPDYLASFAEMRA
ncbi:response regulator [Methylobacterium sp. WL64]|uniref:response regulator n=1 Tax=Methylobacterium sp. WL64 TaxID=2603894 RepID=UPI0011CBCFE9|nr:response regulator [Methylobacterium sp. WL64]TXN00067.1 response regulator [Methylobacterium sp. WL64]